MPRTASRSGRVIALMNQKGGVGKTTTSVNLAAALAAAGRSTLLIDLDPQAHATLHLGLDTRASEGKSSVYDILIDPDHNAAGALQQARDNLWVLPSETDLAGAESELSGVPGRFERLRRALAQLRTDEHAPDFEFTLLDCPPSLGLLTLSGLAAAREVLIPMQAHFLALQGVGKLLETVSMVRQRLNPSLSVAGIVLCMHDTQTTHTREVVADLEGFFTDARDQDVPWRFARVYSPPIRRNIKLAECPSFGQTIFDYAPWAPGALDYAKLADAFIREWDAMHKPGEHNPLSDAEIRVLSGSFQPARSEHTA